MKLRKRQIVLFVIGLAAMLTGISIMGFLGIRKLYREWKKYKLMQENVVIEIAELRIKAPVLEGTDNETLSKAAGHFPDTGAVGQGNYCIAAHSSVIYKEYFNNLKRVQKGMEIRLYDTDDVCCTYLVEDFFIVEPIEIWVLDDFGDDRITLVTCTDDGSQRLIVVGMLAENIPTTE